MDNTNNDELVKMEYMDKHIYILQLYLIQYLLSHYYMLKYYFYYYGKKVMTYIMVKKSPFKFPTERYLNIVKRGYKDCKLDKKYLNKALKS